MESELKKFQILDQDIFIHHRNVGTRMQNVHTRNPYQTCLSGCKIQKLNCIV